MVKRFTETTKWDDPWYRKLNTKHKCIWHFLCDQCDNAGVWKKDYDLASFYIGDSFEEKDIKFLNNGKERIIITKEHLRIIDFIPYQIGDISCDTPSNLQKSCLELIEKHKKRDILITPSLRVSYGYATGIGKGKGNNKGEGKSEIKITKEPSKQEREEIWEDS